MVIREATLEHHEDGSATLMVEPYFLERRSFTIPHLHSPVEVGDGELTLRQLALLKLHREGLSREEDRRAVGRGFAKSSQRRIRGRSAVSREFAAASAAQLKALCERCFDEVDLLIIYLDGVQFGEHHVIVAVGVDTDGHKHLLGLAEGATENATVVRGLLEDLVERGVSPDRRRLFVVDGSKALRSAIDAVFGAGNPVQRRRKHKIDNVVGHLPRELGEQVRSVMKAAYKLDAEEGISKLKQQARWLETEYPSAAASLLEGLEETFTINRLGLPATLRRCLGTTNIVESPTSGVRLRTPRVTNWRNGQMVLRWAAAAYLDTEKSFRRIMGYRDLWILEAALNEPNSDQEEVRIA